MVDVGAVEVYGGGRDGGHLAEHCGVDQFAGLGQFYHKMTPSPTASNISLWLMGSRFLTSLSLRRISLTWLVKALRSASVTVWYTAYFIQYNKIFQYTISTTCQYSTHHPPTTTNHNHHHITNPQQSGRHWSALPARVARSILPSYPILTHTYYISNMLN